jgi:hypothetical protein
MTDSRVVQHADQEALVRHLAETVRRRLAGSDDAGRLIVGREPTEIVVLGVLQPREPPFSPPPVPGLPDEPGVPVDILPPSELGTTVWVDAPRGSRTIQFEIEAQFAIYLPQFPTLDQQRAWMSGLRTADDDERTDDEDVVVGDEEVVMVGPPPPSPATPSAPPTSGKMVHLAPVYRRYEVNAAFAIEVPLAAGVATDGRATQDALDVVVAGARGDRLAVKLRGRSKQGVSKDAIDAGEEAFESEIDSRRTPDLLPLPEVQFLAAATPDPRGGWRVNLTLANTAVSESRRSRPMQTIFDAAFSARLEETAAYRNFGYRLADRDWRVDPQVFAHGRFCVGEIEDDHRTIRTNTWPIHRELVFESRPDLQPSFTDLARNPVDVLSAIHERMKEFEAGWQRFIATTNLDDDDKAACETQLAAFADETRRFARGIQLLELDDRLRQAFVWANEAFLALNTPNGLNPDPSAPRGAPRITSWRLFQIVFIVLGMSALAAREHPDVEELQDELNIADVLWFPTGGGKSEAFLGLVAVALFYDRLRGKSLGVTAFIRFPLRMLSVQQLERVLRVVVACEQVRIAALEAADDLGEPFELGYFVGRQNTPNSLTNVQDDRWGDIDRMNGWSDIDKRRRIVITSCPYCDSTEVTLEPDVAAVRLHHRCLQCERRIPVVITDDEVFRILPAVVVATVDKLAAVAFQPHFSHFTHGPAFRCPDHGYVTFAKGRPDRRRCLAATHCAKEPVDWSAVAPYDPAPALVVQDELHLLAEELGTLAAHYETLFAHLARVGSGRPSKIIAATATISDYENQIRHLYALEPRRFPTEGYRAGETFYASRLDLPRRLFVGALPTQIDTAQFGLIAAMTWRHELDRLRQLPGHDVIALLDLRHYDDSEIADLLFRYELQLFYANRKNDAERVHEQMRRHGNNGPSHFDAELLTGDTPLAAISAAIRRVEAENLTTEPDERKRLAAIAGTSLVSHGVDLARLNVMHVAGMPSTNAYYVQATSRAGRSDVGVVFMAFSRVFARDRAAFHFFEPQHAYANQLVEAVSLNRFAVNAPAKTATGMLSAVIINRIARDVALNPPSGNDVTNLSLTTPFQKWLANQPAEIDQALIDEVLTAYGTHSHVLDPVVARYFSDAIERRLKGELESLRAGTRVTIQKCFLNKPPSSFRDIDEAVEFGTYGYFSGKDFETLTGRRDRDVSDASEAPMAAEEEESQ